MTQGLPKLKYNRQRIDLMAKTMRRSEVPKKDCNRWGFPRRDRGYRFVGFVDGESHYTTPLKGVKN